MFNNIEKFITSEKFYLPIVYILIGIIIFNIIAKIISNISKVKVIGKNTEEFFKRRRTIYKLIKNIIKYLIAIIVIIAILNVYGVNTTSIIASLGIVGVVVGLAFQDIVKDFLAGIFIIFDNHYCVGDWIEINGFKGQVVAIGLRTTKLKAYSGESRILSNSSFNEVTNYSFNDYNLVLKIPFSYSEKIDKIEEILKEVLEEVEKTNENVKSSSLLGIDSFDDSCMKYAISIICKPMTYGIVRRATLKLVKQQFDKNNIEIPYNKLDVHIEK